jgi:hypothetical protein
VQAHSISMGVSRVSQINYESPYGDRLLHNVDCERENSVRGFVRESANFVSLSSNKGAGQQPPLGPSGLFIGWEVP